MIYIYPEQFDCDGKKPTTTSSYVMLGGRKVKMVLQRKPWECGAACVCMLLDYYGKCISLAQACFECNATDGGQSAGDLMRAVKRLGLTCHGYKISVNELRKFKAPLIIYCYANHFMILDRIQDDDVYIVDPAGGNKRISFAELQQIYSGIVLMMDDPT